MFIADMLQADHTQCKDKSEYQIFQLEQEEKLFQEIASINEADYMQLSKGTYQQIKQCTLADITLQSLMNTVMTGLPTWKDEVPV